MRAVFPATTAAGDMGRIQKPVDVFDLDDSILHDITNDESTENPNLMCPYLSDFFVSHILDTDPSNYHRMLWTFHFHLKLYTI
jgi:hypothetical protein